MHHLSAVARFDRVLMGLRRSANTRRLYVGAVHRWFAAGGVPGHLDNLLLSTYLAGLRERCAPSTVNITIKALRAFYRAQAEFEDCSPQEHLRLPRLRHVPPRPVKFLTPEQVGEVLGSLPLHTFAGARDYTLIRLLFETGLRASEMAQLELGSFLDDNTVFVRGKGHRERYVPITDEMRLVLDGYLYARRRARPGKAVALWMTRRGRPLASGRSVWEIVQRRIWAALGRCGGWHAIARVGRPWQGHYPHELRASFATALLRSGVSITAIAQLLGHANTDTTALYLGVDLDFLREALSKHPRAKRPALVLVLDHSATASPADGIPTIPEGPSASPQATAPTETAPTLSSS